MKANEEWVIQSGVSLKYWKPGLGWRDEGARFQSYIAAATTLVNSDAAQCESARIVPAPPREMTDAEAIAWAHGQNISLSGSKQSIVWDVYHFNGGKLAWGLTLFDAIRAARRKLEGK